jgi:hypothetical protein
MFQIPTIQIYDLTKAQLPMRRVHSDSSVSSEDSDGDDRVVPYTLSPLDDCRGSKTNSRENYAFSIVGNAVTATYAKRKTHKKHNTTNQKAKAQGKSM